MNEHDGQPSECPALDDLPHQQREFLAKLLIHTYCLWIAYLQTPHGSKRLGKFLASKILHYSSKLGTFPHMVPTVYHHGVFSEDYREGLSLLRRRGMRLFDIDKRISFEGDTISIIGKLAPEFGVVIGDLVNVYSTTVIPKFFRDGWGWKGWWKESIGRRSVHDHLVALDTPENCMYHSTWGDEENYRKPIIVGIRPDATFLLELDGFLWELLRLFRGDLARRLGKYMIGKKTELQPWQLRISDFNLPGVGEQVDGKPTLWVGYIRRVVGRDLTRYICEMTDTSVFENETHKAVIWLDAGCLKCELAELLNREVIVIGRIAITDQGRVNKAYGVFRLRDSRPAAS